MTEFFPFEDRILILPDTEPEKKGMIIIPDNAKERPVKGTVIRVGPGKVIEATGAMIPTGVKMGDEVMYSKYAGTEITLDDTLYVIMRAGDIFGRLEKSEANKATKDGKKAA